MTINNLPSYASEYEFIVVRFVDGEPWFWGAWHDYEKAVQASMELGADAYVIRTEEL